MDYLHEICINNVKEICKIPFKPHLVDIIKNKYHYHFIQTNQTQLDGVVVFIPENMLDYVAKYHNMIFTYDNDFKLKCVNGVGTCTPEAIGYQLLEFFIIYFERYNDEFMLNETDRTDRTDQFNQQNQQLKRILQIQLQTQKQLKTMLICVVMVVSLFNLFVVLFMPLYKNLC